MANEKFSISGALKYGWGTFKANIPFFLGFMVVMGLLTIVPDVIVSRVFPARSAGLLLSKIALLVVRLFFGMISTRIALDLHDSGKADLGRLQELLSHLPAYLAGKFLYGVMVLIGLILLLVPGIFVGMMFIFVGYLIVDRGLGPIEALQESRVLTDGAKMDLFVFSLVVMLVNLAGMLCLMVGLFVSVPVTMMASVYVYRQLSPAQAA